jgi:hypothetical protein
MPVLVELLQVLLEPLVVQGVAARPVLQALALAISFFEDCLLLQHPKYRKIQLKYL